MYASLKVPTVIPVHSIDSAPLESPHEYTNTRNISQILHEVDLH